MKRSSQMVRLDNSVLDTARFISQQTDIPVSTLVEDACRMAFSWYLKGGQGILKAMGEKKS